MSQKLNLDELIKNSDAEDNTEHIRSIKHSVKIKQDISTFLELKRKFPRIKERGMFESMCLRKCSFLHNNYTDIYNRLIKDELNLKLFSQFISVLEKVENGDEDQHSASVIIGTILKEIYIDSAINREKKENKIKERKLKKKNAVQKNKDKAIKTHFPEKYQREKLGWRDYKNNFIDE